MAEDITPLLLYKGKDWSLFCRAEEKSKEFFSFSICIHFEKRVEVRMLSTIASPVLKNKQFK